MQNKKMGQKTRIEYENGQYVLYLWVPSAKETIQEESEGNRLSGLAFESESGFNRVARKP